MRRWVPYVLLMLVLLLLPGAAMAGDEEGTRTLEWLEHVDVEIDNSDGKVLTIEYDVSVTAGVPVNVFFMGEEQYDDYVDPLVFNTTYYSAHSKLNTRDAQKRFTWSEEGVFHLVIENTGYSSMDTTTVEYTVTWSSGGLWGYPWWCWVILIVVIIIALGLGWIFRRRGGGASVLGPGDQATELRPAGEGVAELGPQPEPPDVEGRVRAPGEGVAELSPQPEPPDAEVRAPGEGHAELSPQPEPPDMDGRVRTHGGGHAELSPQPEPPDLEGHVRTPGEGHAELGPQPEPPDAEMRTPAEDMIRIVKRGHEVTDAEGEGPTGELL